MIVALSQLNSTVGDLNGNANLINEAIQKVRNEADIIVFPEMVLTGYPPKDLLLDSSFINNAYNTLVEISKKIFGTVALVGTVRKVDDKLYNTVAIIQSGKIIGFRDKMLLPTYDVFDEKRYFSSSKIIEPITVNINDNNISIGIQICEDLWDAEYDVKVTDILHDKGAEIIINLSSSPFYNNRIEDRINVVKEKVRKYNKPYIYCNSVGYQEELIFDGQSFSINKHGEIIGLAKGFEEDLLMLDVFKNKTYKFSISSKYEQMFKALSLGVKDYLKKTHHSKVVIGLSGGIDSALTAAIATDALDCKNIFGISMPSKYSSNHSIRDAELLACNLGINFDIIKIHDINKQFLTDLEIFLDKENEGLAEENLQARVRGNILMAIANKKNALLLNTGNKTELALGYSTLYGDMCGALAVISDLNKSEVYELANWINSNCYDKPVIPQSSLDKAPSAELSYNQVDPFDYDIVSPLVEKIIVEGYNVDKLVELGYDYKLCLEIIKKVKLSEYKRYQSPPGIRVSKKAFGTGRRYPIINKYDI